MLHKTLVEVVTVAQTTLIVSLFSYITYDTFRATTPTVMVHEPVPQVVSVRRCSDIMDARRLMTRIQLYNRWPGGESTPVEWQVSIIDVIGNTRGPGRLEVHFSCPGAKEMAGTFYVTTGAIGYRGGLDLNRGDTITIRGALQRDPEGWGASFAELEVVAPGYEHH